MIQGAVSAALDAEIDLLVGAPDFDGLPTRTRVLRAVVDTGYRGALMLPLEFIRSLDLPFLNQIQAVLADGSSSRLDTYLASMFWQGEWRFVEVTGSQGAPILGMALLQGSRLTLDVRPGGAVSIAPLPPGA